MKQSCSPVKKRLDLRLQRGPDIKIFGFVTDIYIDNFHTFCNPYIEKSIKDGAFWDDRYFRSDPKLYILSRILTTPWPRLFWVLKIAIFA